MPLNSNAAFYAALQDYLVRTDAQLQGHVADFVTLFEGRFNREVRCREMETAAGITLSFTGSYNAGTGTLPTDYLEWLDATWSGGGRVSTLRYVEPDSEDWQRKYRPFGDPTIFTTSGGGILVRPGSVSVPGAVTLTYYKAVPPLASNPAGNFLLSNYPDLYMNGSLLEAFVYMKNWERAAEFRPLVERGIAALNNAADTNKVPRRPNHPAEVQSIQEARTQATGAA